MPTGNKPRVSGAIFKNKSGRGPEYTGVIEIDGKKEQIALWPKTSQAGKDYLQIAEDRKKPDIPTPPSPGLRSPPPRNPVRPKSTSDDDDMDDTIPF